MKFIFILLLQINLLLALSINDSLLKIHATIVPKISLMDYEFKEKIENNSINIAIYYNKAHYKNALSLKKQIYTKYKSGIRNYNINVKLFSYKNLDKQKYKATIYYLFPATKDQISEQIKNASVNKSLTFSYLESDLKYGVMLSVKIGANVKPIINLEAIKANGITLRPILLDISLIYRKLSKKLNFLQDISEINYYSFFHNFNKYNKSAIQL
ncbi:MAG: YfiR/HmsC family protein [Sulfurimonas sp.]|nr:YfiR/HmsC family protein [Sulfurimonas sp.]